jgi:trk system potassium uptake protein TrkA
VAAVHIVIAGGGEVGFFLARAFYQSGHDVAIIEAGSAAADRAETLDAKVVRGSAASLASLNEAGIEKAGLFLGVTSSDETNMIACALAKQADCRTIARINGRDFMSEPVSTTRYKSLGIDVAVCPDLVAAHRIANFLTSPTMLDTNAFAGGRIQVFEAKPGAQAPIVGKPVQSVQWPDYVNLCAILREPDIIIPHGLDVIRKNDSVALTMLQDADMPALGALLDMPAQFLQADPIEKVIVAGATRIGIHISRLLEGKANITLVDPDERLCRLAGEELTSTLVVHGAYTDRDLLEDEGIAETDAFVGATERDGANILSCLLAKRLGAKRVLSLLDEADLRPYVGEIGIEHTTSPRYAAVAAILQNAHVDPSFDTLHVLSEGEARVLEVRVLPDAKVAGVPLKRARLPADTIVAAVVRGDEAVIPHGDFQIQAGDRLIMFARTDALGKLKKIL